jgi:hypothetical protein
MRYTRSKSTTLVTPAFSALSDLARLLARQAAAREVIACDLGLHRIAPERAVSETGSATLDSPTTKKDPNQ